MVTLARDVLKEQVVTDGISQSEAREVDETGPRK